MNTKESIHAYHRSRVDAQIGGAIAFILLLLVLAFLVGDKFQPFQQGVDAWSSTLLVWQSDSNAWIPARTARLSEWGSSMERPLIWKEIHPRSYSVVVFIGSLVAAFFLYTCAHRQATLMLSVYGENEENHPYDRPWKEIRVTFWALFIVLLGVLFLFMM